MKFGAGAKPPQVKNPGYVAAHYSVILPLIYEHNQVEIEYKCSRKMRK